VRVAGAIALTVLAAGCGQAPAQRNEPVTRVVIGEQGPKPSPAASKSPTTDACERTEFEGVVLTHCVADPATHRTRTALGPAKGAPYRSFAALAAGLGKDAGKVAFAMNAGMFDEAGQPIGYYVEAGERRRQLNQRDGAGNFHLKPNGVFFGSGAAWRVLDSDAFVAKVSQRPEFGTQSGPMLVIDGKLHPAFAEEGPSRLVRNGVGVDAAGRAHFVLSEDPVSFGRFARYFRDVLKTRNALYLDGSVSALWDPAAGRRDETVPLGPLIVVENRRRSER